MYNGETTGNPLITNQELAENIFNNWICKLLEDPDRKVPSCGEISYIFDGTKPEDYGL